MEDLSRVEVAKKELTLLITEELDNGFLRYKGDAQLTEFLHLAKFEVSYNNTISKDQYVGLWNLIEEMGNEIFDFLMLAQARLLLRFDNEEYMALLYDISRATSIELLNAPTDSLIGTSVPEEISSKFIDSNGKVVLINRNRWIVPMFIISLLNKEVFTHNE